MGTLTSPIGYNWFGNRYKTSYNRFITGFVQIIIGYMLVVGTYKEDVFSLRTSDLG